MKSNAVEATEKPRHQSTEQEMENRVRWVEARLRESPWLKHQLLRKVKEKFNVSRATAERLVSSAREKLLCHLDELKRTHRCESLVVYESIIADPKTSACDKVRAREAVDRLLGLCSPTQSQIQLDANVTAQVKDNVSFDQLAPYLGIKIMKVILEAVREVEKNGGQPDDQRDLGPIKPAGWLPLHRRPPLLASAVEASKDIVDV